MSCESRVRPEISDPAGILPIEDSHHAAVQVWHKSPCESAARPCADTHRDHGKLAGALVQSHACRRGTSFIQLFCDFLAHRLVDGRPHRQTSQMALVMEGRVLAYETTETQHLLGQSGALPISSLGAAKVSPEAMEIAKWE